MKQQELYSSESERTEQVEVAADIDKRARLPLSILETWVVKSFSGVPNNRLPPQNFETFSGGVSFKTPHFSKIYRVEPVKDTQELTPLAPYCQILLATHCPAPSQGPNIKKRRKRIRPSSPLIEKSRKCTKYGDAKNITSGDTLTQFASTTRTPEETPSGNSPEPSLGNPPKRPLIPARGSLPSPPRGAKPRAAIVGSLTPPPGSPEVGLGGGTGEATKAKPTGALKKDQRGTAGKVNANKALGALTNSSRKEPMTQSPQIKPKPLLKREVQERLGKARGPKKETHFLPTDNPILRGYDVYRSDKPYFDQASGVSSFCSYLPLLLEYPRADELADQVAKEAARLPPEASLGVMFLYLKGYVRRGVLRTWHEQRVSTPAQNKLRSIRDGVSRPPIWKLTGQSLLQACGPDYQPSHSQPTKLETNGPEPVTSLLTSLSTLSLPAHQSGN
uniref:Uncharacterized protein n=1 Tax=Timema monikensis TaxID=170555 RepID=A0A7R9HSY2_9NEOP|nr:unnamed protein product [Timema monikensis]